jgi:hypothetical protein
MNEQTVEELTWSRPIYNGKINTKTELGDNQGRKYTTDQLVPPGHCIYPEPHLTSTSVRFYPGRMAKSQRNRDLSENENDSCIKDEFPYTPFTAVGSWRGVRIDGGICGA